MRYCSTLLFIILFQYSLFCQETITYFTLDSLKIIRTVTGGWDLDPATYIKTCNFYERKDNYLYFRDVILEDVDMNTLILMENIGTTTEFYGDVTFIKDKSHVYYRDKEIKNAETNSFRVIYGNYAKDKKNVYYQNKVIKNADPESFKVLDMEYAMDTNCFYSYGKRLKGREAIYIRELYEMTGWINFDIFYTHSKQGDISYIGKRFNCDTESFTDLDMHYAKDKYNAYYKGKKIKGADAASFERANWEEAASVAQQLSIEDNYKYNHWAKDKDYYYFFGKKVK
ncbi:MAG: DKNYY domain-containing protein [Bacteroidales bacterium]|nr:DKNYY domain-containing protein [Bacteroidales bacterium]